MKRILLLLLLLISSFTSVAQGEFITVWDMSKPTYTGLSISFNMTATAPVAYTWTASGGSSGSGSTTTGSITGLPANEIITLRMDPAHLKAISFSNSTTTIHRLIDVTQWGTVAWSNMRRAFWGCLNLNITATDVPDLSGVTDMAEMFYGCTSLTGPANIGSWDTSNVTSMHGMFWIAQVFNQDISSWDTSKVMYMQKMFLNAWNFNQNIGSWDTSKVTDMSYMFQNAISFNKSIGTWNVANVTDMSYMFLGATAFNQDISSWNTTKVTTMRNMFSNATAFNQNLGSWNLRNSGVNMQSMLDNSGMDCASYSATLMGWAANPNTPVSSSLGAIGRQYGTNAQAARNTLTATKNWTITGDSNSGTICTLSLPFITVWDMSKIVPPAINASTIKFNMTATAPVAYTWTASGGSSGSGSTTTGTITGLPANQIITLRMDPAHLKTFSFSTANPTTTTEARLINVAQWGTVAWSSMKNAFTKAVNLNITATDVPDLSGVTDMSNMFAGCSLLNGPANINSWDTSNITNMYGVFGAATNFNQNISSWDTSNVTNMSALFSNTQAFNQNIGNWNTASVTNMAQLFYNAKAFNQDISNWNTANVTLMTQLFRGATNFNQNIGNWDTSKVIDMSYMFQNAISFNKSIGTWNTVEVTDMSYMFLGATAFNQDISSWNTAKVTTMRNMFSNATAFNQNLGSWNLSNGGVNMLSMLDNSGMDCASYSATLMGWAANPNTPVSSSLGAIGRQYGTNAQAARTTLTAKNWTITGDSNSGTICTPPLPFITVWDMSKPGSGSNQLTFNISLYGSCALYLDCLWRQYRKRYHNRYHYRSAGR